MLFQTFGANRFESPQSHVESDLHDFDSPFAEPLQGLGGKVQARCWRRDGRSLARIDGLVAFAIERFVGALDIRRQRYVPQTAQQLVKIAFGAKAKNPQAKLTASFHLRFELAFAKYNLLAGRHLPARADERLPRVACDLTNKQHLNRRLQELAPGWVALSQVLGMNACTTSEESRGKHTRIVDNEKLVAAKQLRKRAKLAILALTGAAVKQEHPRSVAFGRRPLRDSLGRQLVIKVAKVHLFRAATADFRANNIGTRLSIVLREHRRRASPLPISLPLDRFHYAARRAFREPSPAYCSESPSRLVCEALRTWQKAQS